MPDCTSSTAATATDPLLLSRNRPMLEAKSAERVFEERVRGS
jgi:hypothetical protein